MKILITGMAGFIGHHLANRLIAEDTYTVIGLDNINNYYDVKLKYDRLAELGIIKDKIENNKSIISCKYRNLSFIKLNLENSEWLKRLFEIQEFDIVIHLAAQAGVRYSVTNPMAYINSNIVGFVNIMEECRHNNIKHLIYASSSSVYGLNTKMPFSVHDNVDHPVSLYAASKKSNELLAHTYSHLYKLPTTGLRFFTVYGPWGRPDMALHLFTKSILEGQPIDVFNNGKMQRDFTYVDDIVEGIIQVLKKGSPQGNPDWSGENPDPGSSIVPYKVYNIGNNKPVKLMDFIAAIENATFKKAIKNFLPLQLGDVPSTYADVSDFITEFGYKPGTSIQDGVNKFVTWFRKYYKM